MKKKQLTRYRILAPYLSYVKRRAHKASVVDDLPKESIQWLLDDGLIEQTDAELFEASAAEGE